MRRRNASPTQRNVSEVFPNHYKTPRQSNIGGKMPKCDECGRTFDSEKGLELHTEREHSASDRPTTEERAGGEAQEKEEL